LGLSIVKHLVGAHNGSVRVESRVQEGSTFFFTLPAEEAALPRQTPVAG
jgi:signal transduction histidine kinase